MTVVASLVAPAGAAHLAGGTGTSPGPGTLWLAGGRVSGSAAGAQSCVCSLCYSKHGILIKGLVGLLNSDRWDLNSISIL